MRNLFILISEPSAYKSMIDSLFSELSLSPDFISLVEPELQQRWKQLLISRKGQHYTLGKLNWLLYDSYNWIKQVEIYANQFDHVFVLFTNSSFVFHRPPIETLERLKRKKKNVSFILFYIDLVSRPISSYANSLRNQGAFQLVYSFDEQDARKYGFIYWRTPYSRFNTEKLQEEKWDLYLCAAVKERKCQIVEILNACMGKCKVHMDLVVNESNEEALDSDYMGMVEMRKLGHNLPYSEVVSRTVSSNCILDLRLPSQTGLSLRAYEAVVYNKKLLTNNPSILNFHYYNKEYMVFFQSVDQIDWEWVKKEEDVDYHYQNDFSPRLLLDDISGRVNPTERQGWIETNEKRNYGGSC